MVGRYMGNCTEARGGESGVNLIKRLHSIRIIYVFYVGLFNG